MDKELAKNKKNYRLDLLKRRSMIDKYKSAVLTARSTPANEFHGDVLGIVKNDLTGMFPLMEDVSNIAEGYRELVNQSKMPGRWPDLGSAFVQGTAQNIAEHPTQLALPAMGKAGAQGIGKILAETFGQEKEMWLRSMLHIPWDKTKFTKDMIKKMESTSHFSLFSDRTAYGKLSKLAKLNIDDNKKMARPDVAEAAQKLLKRYPDLKNERLAYLTAPVTEGKTNAYRALGNFFLDAEGNVYDDYRWYLEQNRESTKDLLKKFIDIPKEAMTLKKTYPEESFMKLLNDSFNRLGDPAETLAKRYGGNYGVRVKNVIDRERAQQILENSRKNEIENLKWVRGRIKRAKKKRAKEVKF